MSTHGEYPREHLVGPRLRIPHDFTAPGSHGTDIEDGFALLAEDDKGLLVRLDRDVDNNVSATRGSVLYAVRRGYALLAIRVASETDRMRRFRRPRYLDGLVVNCCGHACRYLSIYAHESGQFFDLDVQPAIAQSCARGVLSHVFACHHCGRQHALKL